MLSRDAAATLTEQLAQRYAERIRERLLAPGARLPSVRDCAQRHGVSPHTVVAAYDLLLAQGLIEARRDEAGGLPTVEAFAEAIAEAAVDRALASGDTVFVGSTEWQ